MIAPGYQAQLDYKRRVANARIERLGLTCTIMRPPTALSPNGKPGGSPTVVTSGVPCLLTPTQEPVSRLEQMVAGEVQSLASHAITMAWDTDVHSDDYILIGARRFNVVSGAGDVGTQAFRRLAVLEVNPGQS